MAYKLAESQITISLMEEGGLTPEQLEQLNQASTDASNAVSASRENELAIGNVNAALSDRLNTAEEMADNKMDKQQGQSSMNWEQDGLKISSALSNDTYDTKIGGAGIKFSYNSQVVASINQSALDITKAKITEKLKIGKYAWTVDGDGIALVWEGEDNGNYSI